VHFDGARAAELLDERGLLAALVAELEAGQLRRDADGDEVGATLLAEWRDELARIDRVIERQRRG
jgi:hypothetical protein